METRLPLLPQLSGASPVEIRKWSELLIRQLNQHLGFIHTDISGILSGASGSFTTADSKTVTVTNGIITDIS